MPKRAARTDDRNTEKKQTPQGCHLAGFFVTHTSHAMKKNIVLEALARVIGFMEKDSLTLYGKIFAWALCAGAWLCVITTAIVIVKVLLTW